MKNSIFENPQNNSGEAVMSERQIVLSELELTEADFEILAASVSGDAKRLNRTKFTGRLWERITTVEPFNFLDVRKQDKLLRLVMDALLPKPTEKTTFARRRSKAQTTSQVDVDAIRQKYIDDSIERANR